MTARRFGSVFGYGHRPRVTKTLAWIDRLFADTAPVGGDVDSDLRAFAPGVMNQTQTGSCEAHKAACAIATVDKALGVGLGFVPSQSGLYVLARAHERAAFPNGAAEPLDDSGTDVESILWAIARYGVAPCIPIGDRLSDCDVSTVNDEPTLAQLELDAKAPLVGGYDIVGNDADKLAAVDRALANRYPVGIDAYVDSAYEALDGSAGVVGPCDTSDKAGGYHAQCILARTSSPNGRSYLIRNSWGLSWAKAGEVWVNEAFLTSALALTAFNVKRAP